MKTKSQKFWHEIWDKYVEKQRYDKDGSIKKGFENISDSFMIAQAIWCMSDKEFKEIIKKIQK